MKRWIHAGAFDGICTETVKAAGRDIIKTYENFKCSVSQSGEDIMTVTISDKISKKQTKISLSCSNDSSYSARQKMLAAYLGLN